MYKNRKPIMIRVNFISLFLSLLFFNVTIAQHQDACSSSDQLTFKGIAQNVLCDINSEVPLPAYRSR